MLQDRGVCYRTGVCDAKYRAASRDGLVSLGLYMCAWICRKAAQHKEFKAPQVGDEEAWACRVRECASTLSVYEWWLTVHGLFAFTLDDIVLISEAFITVRIFISWFYVHADRL